MIPQSLGHQRLKGQWQYKITFIAPEGSQAKKGQPLVGFDSSQLQQKLQVKQSELKTAQKTLENTKLTNESTLEKQKLDLAEAKMNQEKAERKWKQSDGLESSLETKKLRIQYLISENEFKRLKRTVSKTIETNKVKTAVAKSNVERLQAGSQSTSSRHRSYDC